MMPRNDSIIRVLAGIFFILLIPTFLWAAPVRRPAMVRQIRGTGTAWFASPMVHGLGSGSRKIIGTFYNIIVWDGNGNELDRVNLGSRVYAPAVVADLEGDGVYEIVAGSGDEVVAYEWRSNRLVSKTGWPASVCSAGSRKPHVAESPIKITRYSSNGANSNNTCPRSTGVPSV